MQRLEEIGAGQVQEQAVATRQQGQVEFLGVDRKTMARPQLDDVATGLEQFALVAQRTHGLVASGLEARLDVIGLDAVL